MSSKYAKPMPNAESLYVIVLVGSTRTAELLNSIPAFPWKVPLLLNVRLESIGNMDVL